MSEPNPEPVQPSAAPKNERKPFVRRECLCGHSISMHDLNGDKIGVCRRCACEQFNEPAQTNTVPMQPSAAPALDVEKIKKRCEAATPGPWRRELIKVIAWKSHVICDLASTMGKYEPEEANAEFIAHAREDIPALLAEVARLRALQESEKG